MDQWEFQHVSRGDAEYEKARFASCWNGRVPDRYPILITYPKRVQHVQSIVRYAKSQNLSIGIKSGGHSWTASFLRDGGILVDMVHMNAFQFDAPSQVAKAEPAAYGSDLNAALQDHGLMFPAGHCPTVGLGGFLLQGGFGWNSRRWGMACESVLAIEVVTADGDLIYADSKTNTDYYWAARGAGCGYFGVVVGFHLRLFPLPRNMMTARYVFELDDMGDVLIAIDEVSDRLSPDLEVGFFVARDQDGIMGRPTLAVTMDALSETEVEARNALALIHELPQFKAAVKASPYIACTLPEMLQRFDDILDNRGRRYEADNGWTDVPIRQLIPLFRRIAENIPPAPSHLYLLWWVPGMSRPDMAFSMEGRLYVALYAISTDKTKDAEHSAFVVSSISSLGPHRKGIQLADENLPADPGKFMQTSKYLQLERLRKRHDPDGRFYGYMRVPQEFELEKSSL